MNQKISVIVPVYNGSKRIERCISGIFGQTYHNMELIIIDDGSNDGSYELVERYVNKCRPEWCEVKLLKQDNSGVSNTRNRGIDIASGEYIFFVDQDDMIAKNYCEHYIETAVIHGSDIVVGGFVRVSDSGKVIRTVGLSNHIWSPYMVVAPWAHVYRRDYLVNNSIRFLTTRIGEDVYFNILAYANTEKITVLTNNTEYRWVNNTESVSNSKQVVASKEKSPLFLLQEIHKQLPDNNCIPAEICEYYFLRYVVWYIMFTVRGTRKDTFFEVMDELYDWLGKEYPGYINNRYIIKKPKGEIFSISIIVKVIMLLHRIHLDKIFLGMITPKK